MVHFILADTGTGAVIGAVTGTFIFPVVGTVGGLIVGAVLGHYWGKGK